MGITDILLPISFKSADISTIDKARKVIKDNNKQIVLVKSVHHSLENTRYVLGQITTKDKETYFLQLPHQKEPKLLPYHDLEELLIPSESTIKVKLYI